MCDIKHAIKRLKVIIYDFKMLAFTNFEELNTGQCNINKHVTNIKIHRSVTLVMKY